jgi:hypothetical protein
MASTSPDTAKGVRAPTGAELLVGLVGVPLGLLLALVYNDHALGNSEQLASDIWAPAGWFVLGYMAIVFLVIRRMTTGNLIALELLWGGNMGMFMFAVGTITGRPVLIGGAMCIVAVDQLAVRDGQSQCLVAAGLLNQLPNVAGIDCGVRLPC